MAPREQYRIHHDHTQNKYREHAASQPSHDNHDESRYNNSTITTNKRAIFFRIGPLRFGYHGIFGILGTIAVSSALFISFMGDEDERKPIPFWLAVSVVITSVANSVGSYDLLPQVPTTSQIASWIFPPHKEAFKRTIAIVGYLNLRLIHGWEWFLKRDSLIFPILLILYTNYHFFPRKLDFLNGNTWVFVIPMFVGFNVDAFMQLPSLDGKAILSGEMNWNDAHEWNEKRVDETYLLLTLLCALQIAFMFTVAFRGRMSIRICYWVAAIEVGLLCIRLR